MKTLNKLIKSFELSCGKKDCGQCPYDDECLDHHVCECYERMNDTLHYLKELRNITDIPMGYFKNGETLQISCPKCHTEFVILPESNNALTWEELRQMEGKPVWIEYGCDFNQKRWVIIHSFYNTGIFCYMNVSGNYPNIFWQKDMGADEYWQAYRKER